VVLFGQLLLGQVVQDCHLFGQQLSTVKALREEHDLADLLQVRDNHGHWTEQCLRADNSIGKDRRAKEEG